MAEDDDKESKTEEPTGRRLDDARGKGSVPTSKEVGTTLLFAGAILLFLFQGPNLWQSMQQRMAFLLSGAIRSDLTTQGVVKLLQELMVDTLLDLAPFFAIFVILAAAGPVLQHGWLVSWEPVKPKFSKLNPIAGLKRLFSFNSIIELGKSILKMGLISLVVYWALKDQAAGLLGLADSTIAGVAQLLVDDSLSILWQVTMAFAAMAVLDFAYQKHEYIKNLRMTKQEVKDELKSTEGDPQIKGRIRQIQREMAQRRMMKEVPQADVVITNPTHYAIALKYTPGEMHAPKVVAKGRDLVAQRIRELARENGVPLVENPPLARALYQDVELDRYVPPELFKAVAEVLAYVFRLRGNVPRRR
ncbi:MAG: flagellar biosynthesis protein FlhB [Magnetococcales bacterium]|nr:flagellar biosynthesis protein FlhB [Magnetococcales bacterium]